MNSAARPESAALPRASLCGLGPVPAHFLSPSPEDASFRSAASAQQGLCLCARNFALFQGLRQTPPSFSRRVFMKHRQRCLPLAGLFLGLALPVCAARADGLQFDPPAPAAFYFTNGKQLVGRVVSLDAERVICKIDVGVNIYPATRFQMIETADQTLTFNAQKKAWGSAGTEKPSPLLE